MEEKQLIEGCIRGDSNAQKRVYELYAPQMLSVCLRYVCNRDTAKDLLHDGFVKLFTKISSFSGKGSFQGWMRRIFVTTALEYLRRNHRLKYGLDDIQMDIQEYENDISIYDRFSANELHSCITLLPDKYRTIFNLYAFEKYKHKEIAKELKINENTVRSQYSRAQQLLKTILNNHIR